MKLWIEVPYGDIDGMSHRNNVANLRDLAWAPERRADIRIFWETAR